MKGARGLEEPTLHFRRIVLLRTAGMVQRGILMMETGIEMFRILDRFVGHCVICQENKPIDFQYQWPARRERTRGMLVGLVLKKERPLRDSANNGAHVEDEYGNDWEKVRLVRNPFPQYTAEI